MIRQTFDGHALGMLQVLSHLIEWFAFLDVDSSACRLVDARFALFIKGPNQTVIAGKVINHVNTLLTVIFFQ